MKKYYFKLGLFVTLGICLAVAAVIVLGAGTLLREEILVESYFEESVQGLNVGSPVKFRGVQIGNVEEITFAGKEYVSQREYVLVRCAVFPDAFQRKGDRLVLEEEVDKGLRVRLSIRNANDLLKQVEAALEDVPEGVD
jgi:hypothetical protein